VDYSVQKADKMDDKVKAAIEAIRAKTGYGVQKADEGGVSSKPAYTARPVTPPRKKKKRKYNAHHRERSRQFFAKLAQERSGIAETAPSVPQDSTSPETDIKVSSDISMAYKGPWHQSVQK